MPSILPKEYIIILYLYTLIIITLINNVNNYIILPFKSNNIKISFNDDAFDKVKDFLSEMNKNQLFTLIPFGNPQKYLEFYFTMEKTIYSVLSNFCPEGTFSSYSPLYSKTFNYLSKDSFSFDTITDGFRAEDNCSFFNDFNLSDSKIIESFEFILGNNSSPGYKNMEPEKFCGSLGLVKNPNEYYLFAKNFISYLKDERIINSYSWGIFFFDKEKSYNIDYDIQNKYDGFYIAGISEDDYINIFKTTNITSTYSSKTNNFISFNKIFFYDSPKNRTQYLVSNNTSIELVLDNNYIITGIEYYEKIKQIFFDKYLEKKVCFENTTVKINEIRYYMIICDSSFNSYLKKFPTLYFYSSDFSFTFNLDYNDAFFELDNKIYFLFIGKGVSDSVWTLGKNFMKKYPFIFNQDQKIIQFVHLDKYGAQNDKANDIRNSNFWNKIRIYFIIFLIIIAIVIGIFIGKIIWKKNRKTRCNELEDNFDYKTDNEPDEKIIENKIN